MAFLFCCVFEKDKEHEVEWWEKKKGESGKLEIGKEYDKNTPYKILKEIFSKYTLR